MKMAALLAIAAAAALPPVTAEVSREGGGIRVRVIAAAERAVGVRYTLDSGGGGNRAVQSGAASLRSGPRAVLLDIIQSATPDWTGTLKVECDDGSTYSVELTPPLTGKLR